MTSTLGEVTRPDGPERRLRWLYGAGVLGLAPWIVYLFVSQDPRAPAHDVDALVFGLLVAIIAGVVATTWTYATGHAFTVMAASFAATAAFISAWFRTLTRTGTTGWVGSIATFALVASVIVVLCTLVIRRALPALAGAGDAEVLRPPDRWLLVALGACALVLVPSLVIVLFAVPQIGIARHLRVAWTGLDVCELLAMAWTGLALSRRSVATVIPATITGTLLLSDAWINVVPTTGSARTFGILLAFLEVPIAAVSFWVAVRVTRRSAGRG